MVFQWVGVEDAKKRAKISLIGCGGDSIRLFVEGGNYMPRR